MSSGKRLLSKSERLAIFKDKLLSAPPAKEAVLNGVEDEFSGVPFNLRNSISDGRMYPPLDDNRSVVSRKPRIERFRSAGHYTFLGANGSIKIVHRDTGNPILDKPGSDGKTVDQI